MLKIISDLLKLGGLPLVAFVLAYKQTGRLDLSTALAIGIAAVLYVWSIIVTALDIYRKKQAESLVEAVQFSNINRVWRYRHRYLRAVYFRHFAVKVQGSRIQGPYRLDIKDVFVKLAIVRGASTPNDRQSMLHYKSDLPDDGEIWDYLRAASKQDFAARLVIIGPPGSGKTTTMKMTALSLREDKFWKRKPIDLLPVLLLLRDNASRILENPDISLAEVIMSDMSQFEPAPSQWFHAILKRGRGLVILDGLDEVSQDDDRVAIVQWVERQMAKYSASPFIVTSRPLGYQSNPIHIADVLKVQPFSRGQQQLFVEKWYLANTKRAFGRETAEVRNEAQESAKKMLSELFSAPEFIALAVNPLLLTMMTSVHQIYQSLPENRNTLYEDICHLSFGARRRAKNIPARLKPNQILQVVQALAFYMMCHDVQKTILIDDAVKAVRDELAKVDLEYDARQFLEDVEKDSGLLFEAELGYYEFAHLTFQEYLVARHIQQHPNEQGWLRDNVVNGAWHPTIQFYAAQTDATEILKACIVDRSITAYSLAIAIEREAQKIDVETRRAFIRALEEDAGSHDKERQRVIGEAFLQLRLRQLIALDGNEHHLIDTKPITNLEYQMFIYDELNEGRERQPDHWRTFEFSGDAQAPITGLRRRDARAFCRWLTARDEEGWVYQLPKDREGDGIGKLKGISFWERDTVRNSGMIDIEDILDNILASVFALDFFLASARASDLASARALARASASASAEALVSALVRASASALDIASASDIASAHALASVLASTLANALANALASDLAIARDLAIALDSTRDIARDIASALDSALDSALASDLASAHDLASASDLAIAIARASDLAIARDYVYLTMGNPVRLLWVQYVNTWVEEQIQKESNLEGLLELKKICDVIEARARGELEAHEMLVISRVFKTEEKSFF